MGDAKEQDLGWADRVPPVGGAETRAVAFLASGELLSTDWWGILCPLMFVLSLLVSVGWIWNTDELVIERKGFILMGIVFSCYAAAVLSKRIRDEHYADLLVAYAQGTGLYHRSIVNNLRSNGSFRAATRFGFMFAVGILFDGIYLMPLAVASKWYISMMCLYDIGFAFVLANHKRNVDVAENLILALKANSDHRA